MAERIPDIAADRRRSNEIETRSNDGVTLGGGGGGGQEWTGDVQ